MNAERVRITVEDTAGNLIADHIKAMHPSSDRARRAAHTRWLNRYMRAYANAWHRIEIKALDSK